MELKYLMLVSTRKWLTAGTPLALLKCNRCIAPAIGKLYGAGRTNMKKLLAILLLAAACFTATAQSDIDYPYNPDFENDGFVGIEDVLELLSVFNAADGVAPTFEQITSFDKTFLVEDSANIA